MSLKFRCEQHEFEWLAEDAGCPRCLKAEWDRLSKELHMLRQEVERLTQLITSCTSPKSGCVHGEHGPCDLLDYLEHDKA